MEVSGEGLDPSVNCVTVTLPVGFLNREEVFKQWMLRCPPKRDSSALAGLAEKQREGREVAPINNTSLFRLQLL